MADIQCSVNKIDDYRFEIPKSAGMKVPGLIFTNEKMLNSICKDNAHKQVANVAYLPGITGKSLAMPDIHWGYGFPIGGVAAMDYNNGVISPGGIGYDINCGVRLIKTDLREEDVRAKLKDLIISLFNNIPSGVGSTGKINLNTEEVKKVLETGAKWAVSKGYGSHEDLKHTEEQGCLQYADGTKVSPRALQRGHEQLGTLGAGNHFLEIQVVKEVFDESVAQTFGLFLGQITIMVHTGSRGLGYQVCDDYLRVMGDATRKYNISIPDRQLACAPVESPEGKNYFAAMCGAANYAWANRQLITHWTRESFMQVLHKGPKDLGLELVYDVAHNIGKIEIHKYNNKDIKLMVHRKGATRAFPSGNTEVPDDYRSVGQPVIIPGSMGTSSYIMVGTTKAMEETWGSTCHGAGRRMSRTEALKTRRGEELARELESKGIVVKSESWKTLAEEAPGAYKDVDMVVDICDKAGISKKIVKMVPIGVIKG